MNITYSEPNTSAEGKRIKILVDGEPSKLRLFRPTGMRGSDSWLVFCGNQPYVGPLPLDKAKYEAERLLNDPEKYAAHTKAAEVLEQIVEPNIAETPRTLGDGQMFLGSSEDGFTRPLCETDPHYLAEKKAYDTASGRYLGIKSSLECIREDALRPFKDDIDRLKIELGAIEPLYHYRRIKLLIEEARVRSEEENATFFACVVSPKLYKDRHGSADWCFAWSKATYADECRALGQENIHILEKFSCGTPALWEEGAA